MNINNPAHPVWPLARLAIVLSALTFILWLTASKFDQTELITICGVFLAHGVFEGGLRLVQRGSQ